MKPLTDTQKKWAMTACLLGVLTFNLSMHNNVNSSYQADFASSEDTAEPQILKTDSGETIKVRYFKNNGDTVAAVQNFTNGKVCTDCGTSYVPLTEVEEKNRNDIHALNMFVVKKWGVKKEAPAVAKADKEEASVATETATVSKEEAARLARNKQDKAALIRKMKACDKTVGASDDGKPTDVEKAKCKTDDFIEYLNSKDDTDEKRVDKGIAKDIFTQYIERNLRDALAPNALYSDLAADKEKYKQDTKETIYMIDKLKSMLPKDHNDLRKQIVKLETSVITARASAFKTALVELQKNPRDNMAIAAALREKDAITELANSFNVMNNPNFSMSNPLDVVRVKESVVNTELLNSLQKAVRNNLISSSFARELYTTEYNKTVEKMMSGISSSITYGGQVDPAKIILDNIAEVHANNPRLGSTSSAPDARSVFPADAFTNRAPVQSAPFMGTTTGPSRSFGGRGG